METLSLHILDIAENSIRAGATKVAVEIVEDEAEDLLTVCIKDDGKGMCRDTSEKARDAFFSTKQGKKVGLGLALLCQAGEQAGGAVTVDSREGVGTEVTATFRRSHPDMQPLGDVLETMAVLVAGHPEIRFIYDHKSSGGAHHFDSHGNGST